MYAALSNSAEIIAGLLGIAVTVVVLIELLTEQRVEQHWDLSRRGINFGYLTEEQRQLLPVLQPSIRSAR